MLTRAVAAQSFAEVRSRRRCRPHGQGEIAAQSPDVEPGEILPYHLDVKYRFKRKEADMESLISNLLAHFEKGSLSRRELVQSLAMLAGSTAAAAQEDLDFSGANIDHVSIQVADLQRSVDFYQKMFGFSVISQDQRLGIIRLGLTRTLVSLNHQSPAGIVDHFAIGVPGFSKESAVRYLKQRNGNPEDDPYAGLHIKDPDGINVQIFSQR
jgi:catechol 2,3-dioxygenase-like lactoylglutathione lyase family enzyme